MSKLIDHALELLKQRDLDALESELHQIAETYRYGNKAREAAEESAAKFHVIIERQKAIIASLELDQEKLLQGKNCTESVIQQQFERLNHEAQMRMQEMEELKAQLREKDAKLKELEG